MRRSITVPTRSIADASRNTFSTPSRGNRCGSVRERQARTTAAASDEAVGGELAELEGAAVEQLVPPTVEPLTNETGLIEE